MPLPSWFDKKVAFPAPNQVLPNQNRHNSKTLKGRTILMGFSITTKDYIAYIQKAYTKIHANGDYITALDAATGDGDHWTNINQGFEKLVEISPELETLSLFEAFKKIGLTMMSVIGGSSGALYGSAYLAAAKVLKEKGTIDKTLLYEILQAMAEGIMARGESKPGMKTMVDTLAPAVEMYQTSLNNNDKEETLLLQVKAAAQQGAESTKQMEAVRGRAFYQTNKGVGHLDPGAVTMCYQLEELADYILEQIHSSL